MTFSALARKEGTTKRSKYVKDTCVRLSRFLDVKIREALHVMKSEVTSCLTGTNWKVVETQVRECLEKNATAMENEMLQQQEYSQDETSDDEQTRKTEVSTDVIDARVGLYGILLARVSMLLLV
ncbi:unnamed protein product [Cylicostephanus goldi]|uniref:Uncharacterized protein n=1 Tax=Cylicostephanus goldi TaxID=71465 RepID=A0A3P6QJH8_CYLGO|nr:unnamed protein product [Cylicostephanus goldi]